MPIRPENRALYPKDWPAISRAVKERAGWKCEQCAAPHMQLIVRSEDLTSYMLERGEVHDAETGEYLGRARGSEYPGGRMVKVILTTAHLDHDELRRRQPASPLPAASSALRREAARRQRAQDGHGPQSQRRPVRLTFLKPKEGWNCR